MGYKPNNRWKSKVRNADSNSSGLTGSPGQASRQQSGDGPRSFTPETRVVQHFKPAYPDLGPGLLF